MLYYLHNLEEFFGPARVFEYLSVRAALAAFIALALGAFFAPRFIQRVQNAIQPERGEELLGNVAQKGRKVPTFGGLIFSVPALVATLLAARPNVYVFVALTVFIGMALIGFFDDYQKIVKKNSDGLSRRAKWILTSAVAVAAFLVLLSKGGFHMDLFKCYIPFLNEPLVAFDGAIFSSNSLSTPVALAFASGVCFLFWLVSVGTSNAVNVTDGVDGLASGCALPNFAVFGAISYLCGNVRWAEYLNVSYVAGVGELSVFCVALIAGILVFLWFNSSPATIYMGDTGSLAIGGALGATALLSGHVILLPLTGAVFVAEAASSLLQTSYFKWTKKKYGEGRRLFSVAPLHHGWQRKGIADSKLVVRCWIVSFALAVLALLLLKMR